MIPPMVVLGDLLYYDISVSQFSKAENPCIETSSKLRKGKNKEIMIRNNARREYKTIVSTAMPVWRVPLPEALVWVPLPLPGGNVSAAVSPCGNEGAGKLCRGGGWATKNARLGKRGSMAVWRSRGLGGVYVSGVHGPRVSELGPRDCQAAGDTFLRHSSEVRLASPRYYPPRFAQLAMGCPNPTYNKPVVAIGSGHSGTWENRGLIGYFCC